MNIFPDSIFRTSAALTLVATACISCHKPENKNANRDSKTQPASTIQQSPSAPQENLKQKSMQQLAESFFREFSIALANDNAEEAAAMIAQEKRERFRKGFRFWQGVHFFDPMVVRVSEDKTLMEVKVSFKKEPGKEDREIKKLLFAGGKWLLLDS